MIHALLLKKNNNIKKNKIDYNFFIYNIKKK